MSCLSSAISYSFRLCHPYNKQGKLCEQREDMGGKQLKKQSKVEPNVMQ